MSAPTNATWGLAIAGALALGVAGVVWATSDDGESGTHAPTPIVLGEEDEPKPVEDDHATFELPKADASSHLIEREASEDDHDEDPEEAATPPKGPLPSRAKRSDPGTEPEHGEMLARVEKARLAHLQFEDTSLRDVVKTLQIVTGMNIVVLAEDYGEDVKFTIDIQDVELTTILDMLTEPYECTWRVKENAIVIEAK